MRFSYCLLVICIFALGFSNAFLTTLRNDIPRLDTNGNIVDCHSGNIVKRGETYFLYGEHYGNNTGFGEKNWPQLKVYTSTDLVVWADQGFALLDAPTGTYFTPWAVFNENTGNFVLWFNAYLNGCCFGNWGVAESSDGLRFKIVTLNESGVYAEVDCNAIFVDDDGSAYVLYSTLVDNHQVSTSPSALFIAYLFSELT